LGPGDGGCEWDWRALRAVCNAEIRRILGRHSAVEDATQEALLRAWRKRDSCRTPADPVAWMRVIARREALRVATRRTDLPLETTDHQGTTDSNPLRSITVIDLRRALDTLGPAERSAVVLRYGQDLTQAEAAARLRIPAGTARVRLHRARARLREELAGYGEP